MTEPLPPPAPGCVHVWTAVLSAAAPRVPHLRAMLSGAELARADRYALERDRIQFAVARGLLRQLLGAYAGHPPPEVAIVEGPAGKPQADLGLKFNLSHSGDLVAFAVASDREVGIDVERIDPDVDVLGLAGRFFSPGEIAALRVLPGEECMVGFFRCWTRKEAFLKAIGLGLSRPLHDFDVSLEAGALSALRWVGWDPAEASRWQVRDLDVGEAYAAALAVEGGASNIQVRPLFP